MDKTVYYLGRAQAQAGHAVAIFSINDKPPIPVPGCEVRSFPVRRLPFPVKNERIRDLVVLRSPLNLPPSLASDLLEWNPNIVHFHFVHIPQAILLARRLRQRGTPYCVSPHGGLVEQAQRRSRLGKRMFSMLFERTYLNRAAFIHAISSADIEGTRAYGVHNRFVIAPNCIDPALLPAGLDESFISRRFPDIVGKRVFTYVGRIDPEQKGLDMLLRAWAGLAARDRAALILVGPDWRDGRARLQAMADDLSVADSVFFFGSVSGKEKWDILESTDVFVHPSRWEGSPFAVLEAMLAGKPLLLTRPADPDGHIAQAGAGVVVSPAEDDLREALIRIQDADSRELNSLGLAGREVLDRHYRWEVTSERVLRAYRIAVDSAT